jgi:hypothetical protein
MRRAPVVVAVIAALPILAATLTTSRAAETASLFDCFVCGERGAADAVANLILFVPLGAALAGLDRRVRVALAAGALLSLFVEAVQIVLPGRDASLGDVVFNALGAALGAGLVGAARQTLTLSVPAAAAASLAAAAAVPAVLVTGAWLLAPELPRGVYFGQWTPNLGHLAWYRGRVLAADLGGVPLPPRRLDDGDRVRQRLLAGAELRVRGQAGPRTTRLGSLFSIYDSRRREIVLVGPDRDDLVLRVRRRAAGWGLDEPDLRLHGALRGTQSGDPLRVRAQLGDRTVCLSVNDVARCGMRLPLGRAWSLVQYPEVLPDVVKQLLDAAWWTGLLLPFGWLARRHPASYAGAAGVILSTVGLGVAGLPFPTVREALGGLAGLLLGVATGTAARRRTRPPVTAPASPATAGA